MLRLDTGDVLRETLVVVLSYVLAMSFVLINHAVNAANADGA